MRILFYTTVLLVLNFSCYNKQDKSIKKLNIKTDSINMYPAEILSNNLENKYDEAKWRLYCMNCDITCRFYPFLNIADTPSLGTLPSRFESVYIFNDTVEIKFRFYYKDSLKCDASICANSSSIKTGVGFSKLSNDPIYYIDDTNVPRFMKFDSLAREINPLQPEVIAFIKNNKNKLNPWFREEAVRREIIQE